MSESVVLYLHLNVGKASWNLTLYAIKTKAKKNRVTTKNEKMKVKNDYEKEATFW